MKLKLLTKEKKIVTLVDTVLEPYYKRDYLRLDGTPFKPEVKPEPPKDNTPIMTRGGEVVPPDAWKKDTPEGKAAKEVIKEKSKEDNGENDREEVKPKKIKVKKVKKKRVQNKIEDIPPAGVEAAEVENEDIVKEENPKKRRGRPKKK